MTADVQAEGSGETVGEAKWQALRELERMHPGLDKDAVRFQVLEEGKRGLLGVGYSPARVLASVPESTLAPVAAEGGESALGAQAREVVERIVQAMGLGCRVVVAEDADSVTISCTGSELGLLIGKHGQTIDAVQYLVNAIVHRAFQTEAKPVTVDAAGYRERRRVTLEAIAARAAERARETGGRVALEPMSAPERKVVHLFLRDEPGIATESEGDEPRRYVVVFAGD